MTFFDFNHASINNFHSDCYAQNRDAANEDDEPGQTKHGDDVETLDPSFEG